MSSDPQYVRLASRVSNGTQVDLNTGWSISGMDVKPFPSDNTAAAAFVRSRMQRNILEPASAAEYEDVQEGRELISQADEARRAASATRTLARALGLPQGTTGIQEAQIREAAKATRASLEAARGDDGPESVQANRDRRLKLIEERNSGSNAADDNQDEDALPDDLSTLTAAELRTELEARNADTNGNKSDLVSRLEELVAAEEEDDA